MNNFYFYYFFADLSAAGRGGQQWRGGDPGQVFNFPEEVQELLVKNLQRQCRRHRKGRLQV